MTPDDLVAAGTADHLRRNGVPEAAERTDRELAAVRIRDLLGDLPAAGLGESPLGTAWTETFRTAPDPVPGPGRLTAAGWLSLAGLRRRLGLAAGEHWAVAEPGGRVLAAVRLEDGPAAVGWGVDWVLQRAVEHGQVRLVDVLELAELRRGGAAFPEASAVLTAAADIETGLGRRDLVKWTSGRRVAAPQPLPRRRRPRRVVVSVTGVDGAGKTTVLEGLARELARCGVPVSRVWLRPGMGLGRLTELAGWLKRRRGLDDGPGINQVAADPDTVLSSRRGAVGWLWSLLVTSSFVIGVRRQHAASYGVVLYDRHVVDALVTLDFAYRGTDLRLQRWLVRRLVPKADVAVHLDVPVEEAVRRKPGDQIGAKAVARQVEMYDAVLGGRAGAVARVDATRDVGSIVREVLERVLAVG